MSDELEETTLEEKETARNNRRKLKEVHEDMLDNKQQMKNVRSDKFTNLLKKYEAVANNMPNANTRELISDAGCLTLLTGALKGQAQTLCDISARFNWNDLAASVSNRFRNDGADSGLDWEKFGSEARMVFNSAPTFTTMVGPIHKEERIRKIAVRRQRENTAGVVNATSETIQNDEEDGNNEATNARVAFLMDYLEHEKDFDLLRTLIDPFNPVQSVENFFDYSYLHKEKRVLHKVDEETGEIKGCVKSADELDKRRKSQMVLSISMKDLVQLTKILYPEEAEGLSQSMASSSSSNNTANNDNSSSSSRRASAGGGSSSGHSHSSGGNSHSKPHPLHREDPLYDAADAQEQVRILAERARQQRNQKQGKDKDGHTQANTQFNTQAGNTQRHTQSTQQQQPQAGSSRRPASQPATAAASSSSSSQGRRGSARDPMAEVALNGSASSSSQARNVTGTPSASRTSATTPNTTGTAASTGTAATAASSAPATAPKRGSANGAVHVNGVHHRAASPGLTPTPPRVPRAASPRTSTPENLRSSPATVKTEAVARALDQELANGAHSRGLLGGAGVGDDAFVSPTSSAPSTPAGRSSAAMALLGMQTAPLPGLKSLQSPQGPRHAESIYASTHRGKENNKRDGLQADLHQHHAHSDDAFLSASDRESQSSGGEFVSSARKSMRTK